MTKPVQQLLDFFDSLSEADKRAAAIEVLRRSAQGPPGFLSDEALIQTADELFLELDARETDDAKS